MNHSGIGLWGVASGGRHTARTPCGTRAIEDFRDRRAGRPWRVPANGSIMLLDAPAPRVARARWTFATSAAEAPPGAVDAQASWTALPGGVVDGGEIVILAIKPSMWRPVIDAAPWLVVSALAAALVASLRLPLPGMSLAGTVQVILLIGFARLGIAIGRWIPTWHVLTNRRIIDVHGVRAPVIASCPLVELRNTYLQISPLDKLLRIGSIVFVTSHAADPPRAWRSVRRPEEVHAHVRRAIENAIDQHGV